MAVLLSLLSVQDIMAKTETRQDALYIFRNDGGFDFFFYGDIDHICYSKIDTAGVEQPDYVVQEVWALDTVFRIPLTAIDSVAFITPETKVWPDVFCPDDRIADYIIDGDSIWWIRLAHDTPADLLPTVGGKMMIEADVSPFIPDGFGGRVAVVEHEDEGWLIATEPTDVTEIYERLVIKAAASTNNDRSRAPQRGFGFDGSYYTDVPEETLYYPDIDETYTLSYGVIEAEGDSWSVAGNLKGTFHPKYSANLTYRGSVFIDVPQQMFNSDAKVAWNHSAEVELALGGELSARIELPFGGKIKKNIAGMKLEIGSGLFIEGSIDGYEVKATYTRDEEIFAYESLLCTNLVSAVAVSPDDLKPEVRLESRVFNSEIDWEGYLPFEDGNFQLPNSASISAGVFAKAESNIAIPIDKAKKVLPEFLVKYMLKHVHNEANDTTGFKLGLGFDMGCKLSMKAPWEFFNQVEDLYNTGNIYTALDEGSEFKASLFYKAGAEMKLGSWALANPKEGELPTKPLGLVPQISSLMQSVDQLQDPIKPYRHRFVAPITRDLIVGTEVGFVVFDEDLEVHAKYCGTPWRGDVSFDLDPEHIFFRNGTYFRSLNIDPGKGKPAYYFAYPMVRLVNGNEMIVPNVGISFEVDSAQFNIPQRVVYVGPAGGMAQGQYIGEKFVEVIPNMENVSLSTKDDWIEGLRWIGDDNKLAFFWKDLPELPEGEKQRRGTIYLTGLSKLDEVLVEDSITVIQAPTIITVEPNKMEFPIEGGTQTATIVETTCSNITARISTDSYADVLHVSLDGNVITVTADENPDEDRRSTWVVLEGTGPDGLPVSSYAIDITQEGTGGDPGPDPENPSNQRRMLNEAFLAHYVRLRTIYYDEIKEEYDTTYGPTAQGMSFDADIEEDDGTYSETITEDGNNLHFVLTASTNWFDCRESATLSFDIIDYKNPPVVGSHQLSNIKFVHDWETETSLGHDEVDISSLPLTKVEDDEYMGFHQYYIESNAEVFEGVDIIRAVYYEYDKITQEAEVNFTPILDYPYNRIFFYIDFMGDIGEYFVWNEEYGLWMPEGLDPSDLPDDPNWDKAKSQDKVKAFKELRNHKVKDKSLLNGMKKQ